VFAENVPRSGSLQGPNGKVKKGVGGLTFLHNRCPFKPEITFPNDFLNVRTFGSLCDNGEP
jgi:hypothetical protein